MYFPGTPSPRPGGQYKRPGIYRARGRARGATRLLLFSDAGNHFRPYDIYNGTPFPSTGAYNNWIGTPYGWAANLTGSSAVSGQASAPTRCSMEALIWYDANCGSLACINEGLGGSGTYDRQLYINNSGQPVFYIYDGATKTAIGSALTLNRLYHLIGTVDGSNIRLYVNGILAATTAAGNAFSGFTNPCLYIGPHTTPTVGGSSVPKLLLVQYASVTWSQSEIMGRYLNPYRDVYLPSEDFMFSFIRGGTVAPPVAAKQGLVTVT